MKALVIYFCFISSVAYNPSGHRISGVVEVRDHIVSTYIYPFGYTEFEIVEGDFEIGKIYTSGYEYYEGITRARFFLKHLHGHGVMIVTERCVTVFYYLTDGTNEYRDTITMTRKNMYTKQDCTCKCQK